MSKMPKFPSINVPLVTILFILLGLFNLDNYYQRYNIEIYNYIEVQEILFSFTNIFPAAFMLVLFYLLNAGFALSSRESRTQESVVFVEQGHEIENARFSRYANRGIRIGTVIIVASKLYFIYKGFMGPSLRESAFRSSMEFDLLSLFGISIICTVIVVLAKKPQKAPYRMFFSATIMVLLLIGYLNLRNHLSHHYTVNGYPKYSATLHFKDSSKLSTDDSLLYIGTVKNYIFFKNKRDSTASIIPISEIREIVISENRNGL